ncbi:single-stranded DNA-binding protein [Ureibacillus composti]|nr:single-stranded DNA-binding protein [Ureibacillus composti]
MINRVTLVGRLTKDPELRYTPNGVPMTRFTVAVNRTFSNQQGEREADFISCLAWRKQAENLANFMKKGSLIGLDGRIQTGSFDGTDGKKVYTTDVITDSIQFLESKRDQHYPAPQPVPNYQLSQQQYTASYQQNQGQVPSYQQPNSNAQQQYTPSYHQNSNLPYDPNNPPF